MLSLTVPCFINAHCDIATEWNSEHCQSLDGPESQRHRGHVHCTGRGGGSLRETACDGVCDRVSHTTHTGIS